MKNKIFLHTFRIVLRRFRFLLRVPTIWKEIQTLYFQKKMRLRTLIISRIY